MNTNYHHEIKRGSTLSDQIKLLSDILNEVLIEQSGRSMFQLEETIRLLTKSYRDSNNPSIVIEDLKELIETLSYKEKLVMVKVFSLLFRLILVLEERYITRVVRGEQGTTASSSLQSAVQYAKNLGLRATDVISILDLNSIKLVFGDHPTGGSQGSMESNLRAVYDYVQKLDDPRINELTRQNYISMIKYHITLMWQSDNMSATHQKVTDRSRTLLYYFESSIVDSISSLLNDMSRVISYVYDDEISSSGNIDYRVPSFISLGSFIGGDLQSLRDPSESFDTIILQKQLCLKIYIQKIEDLIKQLSNSTEVISISKDLKRGLDEETKVFPEFSYKVNILHSNQPYRRKLAFIRAKLLNTLSRLGIENEEMLIDQVDLNPKEGPFYPRSIDFLRDLRQIQNSLKRNKARLIANGPLRNLINLVKIFGFHLTSIDFFQDGESILRVLDDIFTLSGMKTISDLTLPQRMEFLREELQSRRPLGVLNYIDQLSPESFALVESLLIIKEAMEKVSPRTIGSFILNKCNDESQILGFLLLCKELNLSLQSDHSSIDIVPRFTDYTSLINAPRFFKSLFMDPSYMDHLHKRGYIQEVYLDYTNFVKRVGFLQGHYKIYTLQRELIELFARFNIRPRFFLGRGCSVSRGFQSALLGLLSLPLGSISNIKVEENGEIVSSLFSNPHLTTLNLELIANGLLIHAVNDKFIFGTKNPSIPKPEYSIALSWIADRSHEIYSQILQEEDLLNLFRHSTPSDLIAEIVGVSNDFNNFPENIEDSVWVHSWNQSRNMFPMYFGIGSAIKEYISDNGIELLQEMFQKWPLFQSLLNYIQMVIMKVDFKLMDIYSGLCHLQGNQNTVLERMKKEFQLTREIILDVMGQKELMESNPVLREAINGRIPHLDSLGILQVSLLKNWREEKDPKYLKGLIPTVNSIIAGLKNTG